jgi:hypothetical protein
MINFNSLYLENRVIKALFCANFINGALKTAPYEFTLKVFNQL